MRHAETSGFYDRLDAAVEKREKFSVTLRVKGVPEGSPLLKRVRVCTGAAAAIRQMSSEGLVTDDPLKASACARLWAMMTDWVVLRARYVGYSVRWSRYGGRKGSLIFDPRIHDPIRKTRR